MLLGGTTMSIFEIILLNTILITFPLIFYLFYLAYSKSMKKEEHDLFLDVALISSLYFALRFQLDDDSFITLLLLNVPLLIAYQRNRKFSILALTFIIVMKYNELFDWNLIILLLEYMIYYLLANIVIKRRGANYLYSNLFLLVKLIIFTIMIYISPINEYQGFFTLLVWYGICFYGVAYFVVLLFHEGNEIIKLHMTLKEMEQDKQIKTSLFKITHEIKNPIAVCKGYLDMFDVNNVEHSKKYIPIIKDEIERTLLLLQDFLSMTRVSIEKDQIDVNLLLEDVLESYHLLLRSHDIKLDTDLIDDEIYIMGDYNRLTQVFINLVKNSIEAIGNNGALSITCRLEKKEIVITVRDNGCGISREDMKHIKTPFFTTKPKGTGLGVSLSYEIIKAHDGTIDYESELGQGTTVAIRLPVLDIV